MAKRSLGLSYIETGVVRKDDELIPAQRYVEFLVVQWLFPAIEGVRTNRTLSYLQIEYHSDSLLTSFTSLPRLQTSPRRFCLLLNAMFIRQFAHQATTFVASVFIIFASRIRLSSASLVPGRAISFNLYSYIEPVRNAQTRDLFPWNEPF